MTSSQPARDDLIVLTADLDMKLTAETLIGHPKKLSIRTVKFHVRTHERRDPGCRTEAATHLWNFTDRYHYSLVIFDRDGCGSPAPVTRSSEKSNTPSIATVGQAGPRRSSSNPSWKPGSGPLHPKLQPRSDAAPSPN